MVLNAINGNGCSFFQLFHCFLVYIKIILLAGLYLEEWRERGGQMRKLKNMNKNFFFEKKKGNRNG